MQQLTRERDELEKVFRLAESLENQKRDEEKTKKLQELITTKGKEGEFDGSLFISHRVIQIKFKVIFKVRKVSPRIWISNYANGKRKFERNKPKQVVPMLRLHSTPMFENKNVS